MYDVICVDSKTQDISKVILITCKMFFLSQQYKHPVSNEKKNN